MGGIQKSIWTTFEIEGLHCAPQGLQLNEHYLVYPHRHLFKFRVQVEVKDSNREIEFIEFKRKLLSRFNKGRKIHDFGHLSCEMIAEELYVELERLYPHQKIVIEVSEDRENGAKVSN